MIRFILDAILLIALATVAWLRDPFLGTVFLAIAFIYAAQFWRTVHLLGWEESKPDRKRIVMASILSLVFGIGLSFLFEFETPAATEQTLIQLWQEDYMPIWIGMGFFSALLLIYITNERRKR